MTISPPATSRPPRAERRLFVSYRTTDVQRVATVCHCLRRLAQVDYHLHHERQEAGPLTGQVMSAISDSTDFIIFFGAESEDSKWQNLELAEWNIRQGANGHNRLAPVLLSQSVLPSWAEQTVGGLSNVQEPDGGNPQDSALEIATRILSMLRIPHSSFDGLPMELHARYEKEVIEQYLQGHVKPTLIEKGYPPTWPTVRQLSWIGERVPNPLPEVKFGRHREWDAEIAVTARPQCDNGEHSACGKRSCMALSFPEAGPRKTILDRPDLRVGILVSGGIAPGINAVISAIVERHHAYQDSSTRPEATPHKVTIWGFEEGFRALCKKGFADNVRLLELDEAMAAVNDGGSILATSRVDDLLNDDPRVREKLLKRSAETLHTKQLDVLYVIGGEGSMRAAHAISTVYSQMYPDEPLSIIGVPKTMDNDILWVWQSFGFLSAVEKARQTIIQLRTEVTANPRIAVVQLFGSASGYVVSHAAFGSNVCDLALIPEMEFSMEDVCHYLEGVLRRSRNPGARAGRKPPSGIVVMAETAVPTDYLKYRDQKYVGLSEKEQRELDKFHKNHRVLGQTPDELRSGALKIVSRVLERYIKKTMGGDRTLDGNVPPATVPVAAPDGYWRDYRVLVNEPRHIVRSMEPSVTDVAFGVRLGTMAVDTAMAGYCDCMVSQWLTEYVVVPLPLVVLGRKLVPTDGIFWKTVVSKTGQITHDGLIKAWEPESVP